MAIHPNSCESTLSNLELFNVPSTHISTENSRYVKYTPVTTLDRGSPLEFRIRGDQAEYIDLNQSILLLRCRVKTRDGSVLKEKVSDTDDSVPPKSIVFPVNYSIASLFKQVEIYLNGRSISSHDTLYAYRAYLEMLLSYSKSTKEEFISTGGYFPEGNDLENRNEVAGAHKERANPSALQRFNLSKFGKSFELMGRIHTDFFNQGKLLIGNCQVKIVMQRASSKFCLMAENNTHDYDVEIENAYFYAKQDTISPSIREAHLKKLETDTLKYPIKRVEMRYFTKGAGRSDLSEQNLCSGIVPVRIALVLVDSSSFSGHYQKNPFNFKHFNVRSIELSANGKKLPFEEIEVDYVNDKYLMGYLSIFQGTDSIFSDKSLGITPEMYKNGHAIYCFDLETNTPCGEMSLIREGGISVEIKLAETTTESVTLIAYLEYQDMIEIDSDLVVIESKNTP